MDSPDEMARPNPPAERAAKVEPLGSGISTRETYNIVTDLATGKSFDLKTDNFGDFWFEGLEMGRFSLKIESGGKIKMVESISSEKDVNLGDIPLT